MLQAPTASAEQPAVHFKPLFETNCGSAERPADESYKIVGLNGFRDTVSKKR